MNTFAKFAIIAAAGLAPFTAAAAEDSQSVRAPVAASAVKVNSGAMLYGANGYRIASIYRVTADGNPQVILDGKLVTVPASTLSDASGKVTTTLTKKELVTAK